MQTTHDVLVARVHTLDQVTHLLDRMTDYLIGVPSTDKIATAEAYLCQAKALLDDVGEDVA